MPTVSFTKICYLLLVLSLEEVTNTEIYVSIALNCPDLYTNAKSVR